MKIKDSEFQKMMKRPLMKSFQENNQYYNPSHEYDPSESHNVEMIGAEIFRRNALGVHVPFLGIYVKRKITKSLDQMAQLFVDNSLIPSKYRAEQIIPFIVGQTVTTYNGFEIKLGEERVDNNKIRKNYTLSWRYSDLSRKE